MRGLARETEEAGHVGFRSSTVWPQTPRLSSVFK